MTLANVPHRLQFVDIMKKTMAASSSGVGFGALALRKKNTGPPMKWREDKQGPGVTIEGEKKETAKCAADGKTAAVLLGDIYYSGAR